MAESKHIGNNIQHLRLLRGMKQAQLADGMGIAQQNVSKMEKKKNIPEEQLELAARILRTNIEAIKNFDDKTVFQTNIINENQVNHFNSVKDILEYFEVKMTKKDEEIERLKNELSKKGTRTRSKTPEVQKPQLRKVSEG